MEKIKVYVPVDVEKELPNGGIQRVLYNDGEKTAYYNPKGDKGEECSDDADGRSLTFPKIWLKDQEGYFFTAHELAKMRRLDYENGYFQRGVYQDEICTPDDYMSALDIK